MKCPHGGEILGLQLTDFDLRTAIENALILVRERASRLGTSVEDGGRGVYQTGQSRGVMPHYGRIRPRQIAPPVNAKNMDTNPPSAIDSAPGASGFPSRFQCAAILIAIQAIIAVAEPETSNATARVKNRRSMRPAAHDGIRRSGSHVEGIVSSNASGAVRICARRPSTTRPTTK